MEARLTKAEKEEIERMKVLVCLLSYLRRVLLIFKKPKPHACIRLRKAHGMTGRTTIQQARATLVRIWDEDHSSFAFDASPSFQ